MAFVPVNRHVSRPQLDGRHGHAVALNGDYDEGRIAHFGLLTFRREHWGEAVNGYVSASRRDCPTPRQTTAIITPEVVIENGYAIITHIT